MFMWRGMYTFLTSSTPSLYSSIHLSLDLPARDHSQAAVAAPHLQQVFA